MPSTSENSKHRTREQAVAHALGHRARVEILSALGEAEFSEGELVRLLHLPQSVVNYHLQQLLKDGAIEIASSHERRGHERRLYRAIAISDFLVEQLASWSYEKRQAFWALIIQNSGAEAMSALHAGTISSEEKPWLAWARFNVDSEGWSDAYDALEDCWNRIREIEIESDARSEVSGEELQTYVCSLQGYPRSRSGPSSYPKPGA